MRSAVFLLLLVSTMVAGAEIWWLRDTYLPTETRIQSLPIASIDKHWSKVLALSESRLSAEAKQYLAWMRNQSNFGDVRYSSFSIDRDFNADGRRDRAIVGTYQDKSGGYGRFLLILTEGQGGWAKAHLETIPGRPGFSIMHMNGDSIVWTSCFECDIGDIVEWRKDHYELVAPTNNEE